MLKKECGQYLKSPAYYIFLLCMVVDYISQMGTFEAFKTAAEHGVYRNGAEQ